MGYTRLFDVLTHHTPQEIMLAFREDDEWVTYSTEEIIDLTERLAIGLLENGITAGKKIAILSDSRPEWNIIDLGLQQIGAVTVPIYPSMSVENYSHILNEAEIRLVFAENADLLAKLRKVDGVDLDVCTLEPVEDTPYWQELLVDEVSSDDRERLSAIRDDIQPDDLATMIYTSGTTGKPKGVMLTHHNIVSNIKACADILPIRPDDRALSFLPLNHVFERMVTYLYMALGISIYYSRDVDEIGKDLRDVQPQIFTTVPRLLEKVYERIVNKGRQLPLIKRGIFFWALNIAENYQLKRRNILYSLQHTLADRFVYGEWREALGGQVRAVISGGAPLNPRLGRIFTAAGVPVLEGYGLTETSPVLAVNQLDPAERRIGSVGKPLNNVEIRIAEDDEILAKGPNIMEEYYNRPEATEAAFDDEGWFHTEDVGHIDEDGFLYVEDRKDAVFKTSGGKFVAPQPIENRLKESALVEHAMIVGKDRKMVTAVIAPDFENLKGWCEEKDIDWDSHKNLIENDAVCQRYQRVVSDKNAQLDHTEKVKDFILVPDEWSVETDELTPTMKIKRSVITTQYSDEIDKMYETT